MPVLALDETAIGSPKMGNAILLLNKRFLTAPVVSSHSMAVPGTPRRILNTIRCVLHAVEKGRLLQVKLP